MGTVIVVRHGEAEGNLDHRFLGQTQVQLTALGRRQAEAIATRLRNEPVARIVASDLVRSVDTLRPLAATMGLTVQQDPRLREINNGEWSGLLPQEIAEGWPEMWADYIAGVDVPRPGGERWRDVSARVVPFVTELLDSEGTMVIGTHGGPALILALWASGLSADGNIFRGRLAAVHNGSLTVIGEGPRLVSFNDVGHLGSAPDQRLPFEP